MAAALLWARANLRSQWRSAVLVVLIAGLCGGVAMAAIAGARRMVRITGGFERVISDSFRPARISNIGRVRISRRAVPHSISRLLRSE